MRPHYSPYIFDITRKVARQMRIDGETTKEAQFGHTMESGAFWISSDRTKIVDPTEVDVDGDKFYIGIFCKP